MLTLWIEPNPMPGDRMRPLRLTLNHVKETISDVSWSQMLKLSRFFDKKTSSWSEDQKKIKVSRFSICIVYLQEHTLHPLTVIHSPGSSHIFTKGWTCFCLLMVGRNRTFGLSELVFLEKKTLGGWCFLVLQVLPRCVGKNCESKPQQNVEEICFPCSYQCYSPKVSRNVEKKSSLGLD